MMRAIRVVSVEKGYDVREFSLMAFGGAGPLHACEVAQELGIQSVLIPPSPGTLCSLGLLMADTRFDFCRTSIMDATEAVLPQAQQIFEDLMTEGGKMLTKEGISEDLRAFELSLDMRYDRQNYEITVPLQGLCITADVLKKAIEDFHAAHKKAYGYRNDHAPVKLISFRVSAIGTVEKPQLHGEPVNEHAPAPVPVDSRPVLFANETAYMPTNVYQRDSFVPGTKISGPAIIEQMDTTIVIPPKWHVETDGFANLKVTYGEEGKENA